LLRSSGSSVVYNQSVFNSALLTMWDRIMPLLWDRYKAAPLRSPERIERHNDIVDVYNWTFSDLCKLSYSDVSFGAPTRWPYA
jgi:hypothetical protein